VEQTYDVHGVHHCKKNGVQVDESILFNQTGSNKYV